METMTELARRVVACKHWRWMPGMLESHGYRVLAVSSEFVTLDTIECWLEEPSYPRAEHMGVKSSECLPDLTDPATVGCLLALVREAWGDQRMFITYDDGDTQ